LKHPTSPVADLLKARTSILENAYRYFCARKGVSGLFLSGSLADESADNYSDIDLRVVVEDQYYLDLIADRESAPENWGDFLFHETIGPSWTVSYYKPFNKIDLFYYKASELDASPWHALPIKILFDKDNSISDMVHKSKDLSFKFSDSEILNLNRKAVAIISEVVKRIARDEYLYAHRMITNLVEIVINNYDHLNGTPPLGSSKFVNREASSFKSKLESLSFARENQISDLQILIGIVSKNLDVVGTENLPLALKMAKDELTDLSKKKVPNS